MRTRKKPILIFVAIFAALITIFIAKSNEEPSDCFTWKVKINESTFYLTGSIHAANEANYPLDKTYLKSYQKADKVIFELKDNFKTLEKKIFQYAEKDKLSEDENLGHFLKPESIEKLKQIIDETKLKHYFQYEGWLLNMVISGKKSKLIGYDPLLAVDKYFHDLAEKDQKEIIGLDNIETQLELFDFELPHEMQIKILEKAISKMETAAKSQEALYKSYFDNDLIQLETECLKPFDFNKPQMKQIYDRVFTQRNTAWVAKFEKLATEEPGTYFVLVGSGHYFGSNNVRELLENKGYIVEKI